jgi:UDP-N-acetylmuramyl pentapeptide phosphotransferase/UDP-N-acetylglucosamine-1-phosphate transferase
LRGLSRWAVIDSPNARSSHTRPTPRGGGLGFMAVILVGWTALWLAGSQIATPAVIVGAAAIAAISFADDLKSVQLGARLVVQAIAVALALATFPSDTPILAGVLPVVVDRIVVALAWLWFINLFNFMDGIDGIAAGEAAIVAFGLVVLAAFYPQLGLAAPEAIVVGAAVVGFFRFNWPPARVFMGDVGSVGLGYVLGWLLVVATARGALVPALLLPLYFAADASTTLLARAWRRQPLIQAHRDHAYQNAVDRGLGQAMVSSLIVGLGLLLIALAVVSVPAPIVALGLGLAVTAALIVWLRLG